jgi:hypothetical protein
MNKPTLALMLAALTMQFTAANAAVVLVETSDPGFYNNQIGTVLNLSNPGGDGPTQPFPLSNDSTVSFPTAPSLAAASSILGNWLTDPLHLNSNWSSSQIPIPNSWAINTEVAVIYQFDTLGATNVNARFGVDNGIFLWLDGQYLFGARAGGSFSLGEYSIPLGDLAAGTHFLQLLLEDHGSTNGYAVEITADTFIPAPPPAQVPEPTTLAILALGLAILCLQLRRKQK